MTNIDPAIRRAERLRAVMAMPEYGDTIGTWIQQAHDEALHEMATAPVDGVLRAQGAYHALETLKSQFNLVFDAERAAHAKLERKKLKEA